MPSLRVRLGLAALLMLPAVAPLARSDEARGAAPAAAQIQALIDRWTQAVEARDLEGVMALYAPGDAVVAYDLVPPLQYRGKEAYRENFRQMFAQYQGRMHVEYRDLHILSSGDLAVIYALERLSGDSAHGHTGGAWVRATSVARRLHGQWLLVHDHVSVPVDLDSGRALLALKP
jgi:uncharacterized protein (TIGR02246 family)